MNANGTSHLWSPCLYTSVEYQMKNSRGLCLFVILSLLVLFTHAVKFDGVISDSAYEDNFVYIGKFSFDYTTGEKHSLPAGAVDLTLTSYDGKGIQGAEGLEFWLFDDEDTSWPAMRFKDVPCNERYKYSRGVFPITFKKDKEGMLKYHRIFDISQHIRPRTWWFILGSCKGKFGNLHYNVHAYNTQVKPLHRELGTNERHLPLILQVSLASYLFLALWHVYGLFVRREENGNDGTLFGTANRRLHQVIQLFTVSLGVMAASVLMKLLHYSLLSMNGWGVVWLDRLGDVCDVLARVQLTMLLMLLGAGWTVSVTTLRSRKSILTALGSFGAVYILLLSSKFFLADTHYVHLPVWAMFILDTALAGWCVIALWFAGTVLRSYLREYKPHRRALYLRLGIGYTLWLLSEPAVVVVSQLVDPWVREQIVETVATCTAVAAYAGLCYLLQPAVSKHYLIIDKVTNQDLDEEDVAIIGDEGL